LTALCEQQVLNFPRIYIIDRILIVTALQRRDASAAAPAARVRGIPRPT